jgi:hypothetical protein
VTRIGPERPRRSLGCSIAVFLTNPPYPTEDVGTAIVACPCDPNACMATFRDDACGYGGDTIYGFVRGVRGDPAMLRATIATRGRATTTARPLK